MPKRPPARIFISHSHVDNDFGVRLATDLRRELDDEHAVWYDVSGGLHGGDAWWRKIVQEITDCPIFVVVLSPEAMESRWVNDEIDLAWNLKNTPEGKTIIPLLYRACTPRADLLTRHIISFMSPRTYEMALGETLAALGVRGRMASAAAPPATPTAQAAARATPDIVSQFTPQIEAAYARRDWPDVVRKTEFVTRRAQGEMTAHLYRMLGVALLENGAPSRAREALDSALALDPLDLDALRAAARAAVMLGEPQVAHSLLDDALALASDNALRLRLLADDAYALRLAGATDEEIRRCDEALRLASDDPEWRARRVVALTLAGRIADAQAEMDYLAREAVVRGGAESVSRLQEESRALRMALAREARRFGEARTVDERRVVAERFAALLSRNVSAASSTTSPVDDPLSPLRLQAPQLPERLATLGYIMRPFGEREAILPPLCEVAGGRLLLSEGAAWEPGVAARDLPHRWANLAGFQIARYPVTVAEYACFARAQRREPQRWENGGQRLDWQIQLTRPDHPVVCVTWHDALAYAAWLSGLTGQQWRLPTEAEWEAAARWDMAGQRALAYPWGDDFDPGRCNCATAIGMTTAVGSYPAGASPYGVYDLAGNVWEWTSNLAGDGSAEASPDPEPVEIAMLRGGSWVSAPSDVSGVARAIREPYGYSPAIGFRLVCPSGV